MKVYLFVNDLLYTKKKNESQIKIIPFLASFTHNGISTHFLKEEKQKDQVIVMSLGFYFLACKMAARHCGIEWVNPRTRLLSSRISHVLGYTSTCNPAKLHEGARAQHVACSSPEAGAL